MIKECQEQSGGDSNIAEFKLPDEDKRQKQCHERGKLILRLEVPLRIWIGVIDYVHRPPLNEDEDEKIAKNDPLPKKTIQFPDIQLSPLLLRDT